MKSLGQSYWTPIWIVSPACKHLKWWIFAMKGWGTCHLAPSWPHSYLRILKVLPRRAGAAPGRLTGMELFTDWDRKSRSYELYTYIYIYIIYIYNICNMYTKYVKIHMMGSCSSFSGSFLRRIVYLHNSGAARVTRDSTYDSRYHWTPVEKGNVLCMCHGESFG